MLGANLLIVWATVMILANLCARGAERIGEERPVAIAPESDLNELVGQE